MSLPTTKPTGRRWRICEDCDGTGIEQMPCEPDELWCEFCRGTGRIAQEETLVMPLDTYRTAHLQSLARRAGLAGREDPEIAFDRLLALKPCSSTIGWTFRSRRKRQPRLQFWFSDRPCGAPDLVDQDLVAAVRQALAGQANTESCGSAQADALSPEGSAAGSTPARVLPATVAGREDV